MKRLSIVTIGLLIVGLTAFGCASTSTQSGEGWITLIDGTGGLDNWNRVGDANWRAQDGAIVADKGKGGYLVSKSPYRDFHLRAEFWAEHNTNSGIFIRCAEPANITAATCYEVNIYDARPDPSYGTGGIVDVAKIAPMPKAAGKWNTYEITAQGSHLIVVLNGAKTVDVHNTKHAQGPFALQFGNLPKDPGGAIKWRKVQIKPL
jgi:hypothetical protein